MIKAKEIRKDTTKVTDKLGLYEWWFLESDAKALIGNWQGLVFDKIKSKVIDGNTYLALYLGQAKRETLRQRLNWHINQQHTPKAIESGYLSTLRQTISALLEIDESKSQDKVNSIINNALIETKELPKEEIDTAEKEKINGGYYPLNIQGNKKVDKEFLRELRRLRKKHKK